MYPTKYMLETHQEALKIINDGTLSMFTKLPKYIIF